MYVNTETGEYPITEEEIRARHPQWLFPIPFEPADGYAKVEKTDRPSHNPATHQVKEADPVQDGDKWRQKWSVVKLKASEVSSLLSAEKERLSAEATAKRWEIETGGISLEGGLRIDTKREDQDAITRVVANAPAAGIKEFPFKAASGWTSLTFDQLQGVASAVALHVQACYGAERAHYEAIAALTSLADAQAYDINVNWPQA